MIFGKPGDGGDMTVPWPLRLMAMAVGASSGKKRLSMWAIPREDGLFRGICQIKGDALNSDQHKD